MNECLVIIKSLLQFFALSADEQVLYGQEIPEDGYRKDFPWDLEHSPSKELAISFSEYLPWLQEYLEKDAGEVRSLANELAEVLALMSCSQLSADLWSKAALRDRPVWNVVRRLSRKILEVAEWLPMPPDIAFEELVNQVRD